MLKRIVLNEGNFRALVRGDVVHDVDVEIALADIGFDRMVEIIGDAIEASQEVNEG